MLAYPNEGVAEEVEFSEDDHEEGFKIDDEPGDIWAASDYWERWGAHAPVVHIQTSG